MIDNLNTRWEKGTNELILKLEEKGIDFKKMDALEMFGRDGTWHTSIFAKKVQSIEIWEIDKKWEQNLNYNFPNSKIKILDSIKTISTNQLFSKFDLLLIDNPMNIFGDKSKNDDKLYCEHFDLITKIEKLSKNKILVIFNVNKCPFNYENYPIWKKFRESFYGNVDTSNMKLDFLHTFYHDLFKKLGFTTIFSIDTVRVVYQKKDMTYYFAYYLQKNTK